MTDCTFVFLHKRRSAATITNTAARAAPPVTRPPCLAVAHQAQLPCYRRYLRALLKHLLLCSLQLRVQQQALKRRTKKKKAWSTVMPTPAALGRPPAATWRILKSGAAVRCLRWALLFHSITDLQCLLHLLLNINMQQPSTYLSQFNFIMTGGQSYLNKVLFLSIFSKMVASIGSHWKSQWLPIEARRSRKRS